MDKRALKAIRKALLAAREELVADMEGSSAEVRELRDPTDTPAELGEKASTEFNQEVYYSLRHRSGLTLRQIDEALRRIDEGTFGKCERCGKDIGKARLMAMPLATMCIACKEKEEKGLL